MSVQVKTKVFEVVTKKVIVEFGSGQGGSGGRLDSGLLLKDPERPGVRQKIICQFFFALAQKELAEAGHNPGLLGGQAHAWEAARQTKEVWEGRFLLDLQAGGQGQASQLYALCIIERLGLAEQLGQPGRERQRRQLLVLLQPEQQEFQA